MLPTAETAPKAPPQRGWKRRARGGEGRGQASRASLSPFPRALSIKQTSRGGRGGGVFARHRRRRELELRGEACIAWHAYAARSLRGRRIEDRSTPIGVHSKLMSCARIKLRCEAWGWLREEAVEGTHGGTEHGLGADCARRRGLELRGEACIAWHAYAGILRGRCIEDRSTPIGVHSKLMSCIKIKLRGEACIALHAFEANELQQNQATRRGLRVAARGDRGGEARGH